MLIFTYTGKGVNNLIDVNRMVIEAANECNIKTNSEISSDEVVKLVSKSLEKIIYSKDFIDYIDEELGSKVR